MDPQLFDAALAAYLDDDMPRYEAAEFARRSVDRDFEADYDHAAGVLGLSESDLRRTRIANVQINKRMRCRVCGSVGHSTYHHRPEEGQ